MLAEIQDNYGRAGVTYLILGAAQDNILHESVIGVAVGLDVDVVAKYLDCMVEHDLLDSVAGGYMTALLGREYRDKFGDLQSILEGGENPGKFKDLP